MVVRGQVEGHLLAWCQKWACLLEDCRQPGSCLVQASCAVVGAGLPRRLVCGFLGPVTLGPLPVFWNTTLGVAHTLSNW